MPDVGESGRANVGRSSAGESVGAGFGRKGGRARASGDVKMSPYLMAFILAGAGVLVFLYFRQQQHDQPRYETRDLHVVGMTDFGDTIPEGGMGDHFLLPEHHIGETVTLPIRFPARSGINITALINQGFGAMSRSAPQDAEWMQSPPSEVDV